MNPRIPRGDDAHRVVREQLGAYVLGGLTAAEDAAVTEHLGRCPECRAEHDAIVPLVVPLGAADPDRLDDHLVPDAGRDAGSGTASVPDLFPGIRERIRAEAAVNDGDSRGAAGVAAAVVPFRSPPLRIRLLVAAAGLVIALAGVGAGLAVGLEVGGGAAPETVSVQALVPGLDASAGVVPHTWGVEMTLTATGFAPGQAYRATVLDRGGRRVDAGAFLGTGSKKMECHLNSSVLRRDASAFVVTDAAGAEVLVSRLA